MPGLWSLYAKSLLLIVKRAEEAGRTYFLPVIAFSLHAGVTQNVSTTYLP